MSRVNGFGVIAAAAIIGTIITVIIGLAFYIFLSFALYKLAEKRNMEMPWLAWIPVAQMYILGKMVRTMKISTFEIPSLEIILPVALLASVILGGIPVLGTIISLVFYALLILTLYNLYKQYLPEQAVVYTVLSILVVTVPFFLLKISKMDPVNMA